MQAARRTVRGITEEAKTIRTDQEEAARSVMEAELVVRVLMIIMARAHLRRWCDMKAGEVGSGQRQVGREAASKWEEARQVGGAGWP